MEDRTWKTIEDWQAREVLDAMKRREDAFNRDMLKGASAALALVVVPDKPDEMDVGEAVDCIADYMLERKALEEALGSIGLKIEEAVAEALKEMRIGNVSVKVVG